LNVIALTDHNSCKNCPATVKAGEKAGICVIPGMELSTSEDIHMVCLFEEVENALRFSEYVRESSMHIANKPEVYGRQIIMDENDIPTDEEHDLLIVASGISADEAYDTVIKFGGFCYPAHIDRDSYSITSVLGAFVPECNHGFAEISYNAEVEKIKSKFSLGDVKIIRSSDAHYLENMRDAENYLELDKINAHEVLRYFKQNGN
jgi:DNA polymerase III alpha subunit